MSRQPRLFDNYFVPIALQVAMHFVQASAHFLQHGMSPHFMHSAAQASHALAQSAHMSDDKGASYSISATHARQVSRHVRQCFSQCGQSQLTRHSRHACKHSPQALMQFALSTGSIFVSAALAEEETAMSPASKTRHDDTDIKNRDIFHLMMESCMKNTLHARN
jgi:hypothetical protein